MTQTRQIFRSHEFPASRSSVQSARAADRLIVGLLLLLVRTRRQIIRRQHPYLKDYHRRWVVLKPSGPESCVWHDRQARPILLTRARTPQH